MKQQILVVNKNIAFCQAFKERMQNNCASVCCTQTEINALDVFMKQECSLVIFDIQPSDNNRMKMLQIMRRTKHIPILALTPPLKKEEKIALFQAGVDVCLDQTTDIDLCVAQVNALIKIYLEANTEQEKNDVIVYGAELIINFRYRQVIVDGESLELTRKEFDLLHYLASNQRQVFSRKQLYNQVWHDSTTESGEETVRVHLNTLRKKLSQMNKDVIENVRGVGYRFVPPPLTEI